MSQQESSNPSSTEIAVLGGGCFWCTEAVFRDVKGVRSVTSGYCGGHVEHPSYHAVCSGNTGHVEVVKVEFDSEIIGFATVLEIFFATHDPTPPDRQGADVGPQYASAIFCSSGCSVRASASFATRAASMVPVEGFIASSMSCSTLRRVRAFVYSR